MRTVMRVGVALSVVAAPGLYGAQLLAPVAGAVGILFVGLLAGVSVAKWLERDWYGRQFEAGARAGAIACGVGGVSALLYLLGQGPRSVDALVAGSHAPGVPLAEWVSALAPLGWVGVDVVTVVVAVALGVALASLSALIFGWGKSKRAVRVVAQARLAARALQPSSTWGPSVSALRSSAPPTLLYAPSGPTAPLTSLASLASLAPLAPTAHTLGGPSGPASVLPPDTLRGMTLASASDPGAWVSVSQPPIERAPAPPRPPTPSAPASDPARPAEPGPRRPTNARSAEEALNADERAALAAWEEEMQDDDDPNERGSTSSAFLMQAPPPRRNRKKQNTRDWLC